MFSLFPWSKYSIEWGSPTQGSTSYLWNYNLFIQIRIYQDKWESNLRCINHADYWNLSYSIKSLDDLQVYSCLQTWSLSSWIDIYFCEISKRIPIISQLPGIKVCLRPGALSDLSPISLYNSNTEVGYLLRILTLLIISILSLGFT